MRAGSGGRAGAGASVWAAGEHAGEGASRPCNWPWAERDGSLMAGTTKPEGLLLGQGAAVKGGNPESVEGLRCSREDAKLWEAVGVRNDPFRAPSAMEAETRGHVGCLKDLSPVWGRDCTPVTGAYDSACWECPSFPFG